MARISFVTWDGGGNLPPALAIAQALRDRGHESHFLGYEVQRPRIEAQGFPFTAAFGRDGAVVVQRLPPAERLPALVRHVFACPEHLAELPAALAAAATDLLVVDFLMLGAMAAVERERIPAMALAHSTVTGLVPPPQSPPGGSFVPHDSVLPGAAVTITPDRASVTMCLASRTVGPAMRAARRRCSDSMRSNCPGTAIPWHHTPPARAPAETRISAPWWRAG